MQYSWKCDTPSRALHLQGCRHNKDTADNQLCPLWYPFCQTQRVQIMKWLLRTDSFNQVQFGQVCSQTLKSIIVVERGREVNSSHGTSGIASWRIHGELSIFLWGLWPHTLDFGAIRKKNVTFYTKCSAAIILDFIWWSSFCLLV